MVTADTIFLVVDDADTMRKINSTQLNRLGARQILLANNGLEALKTLNARRVNVILSDWSMPVMDGLELLRQVRADKRLATLPFIMITAECEREQIAQAIAAGVSSILIKPYTAQDLAQHIARAMQHRPEYKPRLELVEASAMPPVTVRNARPTLLVVDDMPDNLSLIAGLFMQDYRVRVAQDARMALALCTSNTPPDLLLLDVMMPNMDGFELAKRLRDHPQAGRIPIIFITAMTDPASRQRGLELGAVNYVTKPIDPEMLRLRVSNLLRHVEQHKQLQAEYDDLLALARLREDIEQITRHDLKAPLAGILGLVRDLLDGDNLLLGQQNLLQLLEQNSLQLLDMINLSAELYKIETGRFELQPAAVAVVPMFRRLVEIARITFKAKELTLELQLADLTDEMQPQAWGDAMLCFSLLNNLLKNACEAAPIGSRVKIAVSAGKGARVHISLENQPVVPAEFRAQFFDKFSSFGKHSGSGLGTYSAKLLTEAQNGCLTLEVDDQANLTRLRVELPLRDEHHGSTAD